MKKAIFIALIITIATLILFLLSACDLKKVVNETKDSTQFDLEISNESTQDLESNNKDIQDSVSPEDAEAFEKLYNPLEGGNPENIGKIIFCSQSNETEEIADYFLYSIDPEGSNMTRLPFFGNYMFQPEWSPEYSRIAYSAHLGNTDKIFIMTADGSENKQVTFGEGSDKFPTWSPDGKRLAYISYVDGVPNLFIIDIDGQNKKQLTFADGEEGVKWPSYSPVEEVIAYSYFTSEEGTGGRILTIKSDGTETVELPAPSKSSAHYDHPGWSPDGKIIYFISNQTGHGEVYKVDYYKFIHNLTADNEDKYDDIGLVQLTNLVSLGAAATFRPRVSPDGEKIVFCGGIPEEQKSGFNLITINNGGTDVTNITDFTGDACEWPDW